MSANATPILFGTLSAKSSLGISTARSSSPRSPSLQSTATNLRTNARLGGFSSSGANRSNVIGGTSGRSGGSSFGGISRSSGFGLSGSTPSSSTPRLSVGPRTRTGGNGFRVSRNDRRIFRQQILQTSTQGPILPSGGDQQPLIVQTRTTTQDGQRVPEPGVGLMLLIGVAGTLALRSRRARVSTRQNQTI